MAGGEILVSGRVRCEAGVLPEAGGPITVSGDGTAELVFGPTGEMTFSSPVVLRNLAIVSQGTLTVKSLGSLTAEKDVTVEGIVNLDIASDKGKLTLAGGQYAGITLSGKETEVLVEGAKIASIGGSPALFTMTEGELTEVSLTAGEGAIYRLFGGEIGKLTLSGGAFTLYLGNAAIAEYDGSGLTGDASSRTLLKGRNASEAAAALFGSGFGSVSEANLVYLADGGKGDGSSPYSPLGSLSDAIKALGGDGRVVLCGDYTHTTMRTTLYDYKLTLSANDGMTTYDASLRMNASLSFGGETLIEKLRFAVAKSDVTIYGMGHPLTIGEGVSTILEKGNTSYINLCGGSADANVKTDISLTVSSGEWGWLRGGSVNSGAVTMNSQKVSIVINGGSFRRYVALSAYGYSYGSASLIVNGGTFYGGIYGVMSDTELSHSIDWDFTIELNDGTVYFQIAPALQRSTQLRGSYKVILNGGDYSHLTDLLGAEKFAGNMTSELVVGDGVDLTAKETGEIDFTNYLRPGADPWLFTHDGYYYYAATGGILHKVANLADLAYSTGYKIYNPVRGTPYGHRMWSPEIHYFSAEEVGEEYAGWYLFICCDDGSVETTEKLRAYVLKCLDGDDLLGRWGHPITGEVNVPVQMYNEDDPSVNNNNALFGGMSVVRIDGVPYITFISEVGRGTADYYQAISITRMKTPWIMYGESTVICKPEYDWEKGGYGKAENEDKWWPMVVEGSTAVYGDNGEVFIVYSGSGYWTTEYNLALLTYTGGDPLSASSWKKATKPFLYKSDSINGCGHASYITDVDGQRWVCYHAYTGRDTSSGRFIFVEPYTIDKNGLTVGNGSGHPNDIDTVYTVNVNPKSLSEKIDGFVAEPEKPAESGSDSVSESEPTADSDNGTVLFIVICAVIAVAAIGAVAFVLLSGKKK